MTTQNTNALNPSVIPYSQTLSAPDEFFAPKIEANAIGAYDTATALLEQALAGVTVLLVDGNENMASKQFAFSHNTTLNLLWAIETQLNMLKIALRHIADADITNKEGANHA